MASGSYHHLRVRPSGSGEASASIHPPPSPSVSWEGPCLQIRAQCPTSLGLQDPPQEFWGLSMSRKQLGKSWLFRGEKGARGDYVPKPQSSRHSRISL